MYSNVIDEYAHKNDELLHSYTTSENDKNRIIYPDIAIIDDDEEYKYRYNSKKLFTISISRINL